MPVRTPFVGETETLDSPLDKDVKFVLRRVNTGQVIAHRDRNSVVRFITQDDENGERYIQEKDYPVGTMTLDTVLLVLFSWNIQDDKHENIAITRENIVEYLAPEEIDAIYEKGLEINPILSNREKQKKDSKTN